MVVRLEPRVGQRHRALRSRQNQPSRGPAGEKRLPRAVPPDRREFQVIHARAPHPLVGPHEAAGLDHIDLNPKAGGEPEDGSGVLGNVGLVQNEAHSRI